jgi:hypothetical protein
MQVMRAMSMHTSQWVWYRRLFVVFARWGLTESASAHPDIKRTLRSHRLRVKWHPVRWRAISIRGSLQPTRFEPSFLESKGIS